MRKSKFESNVTEDFQCSGAYAREFCQDSHWHGHWQRRHQRVNEGDGGFSERTLDAEVDDPGLKKERRERLPSRDPPPVVHKRDA
ncbi:hypothetical protein TNCV_4627821 [Trichonephila clavipes]|nr:hypothetical protein TNCV_4627821 [Trichonephila clavipes]